MSESALDRTARALDLVPYLLEHQGISIAELAEVFGVTVKQINDDLILIHMCGLPGYTPLELIEMYYEDGYVTVSDPQSLKKPRSMNRSEITSLLVSLDLLKSIRSDAIAYEIEVLKLKLQKSFSFENPYVVIADSKISDIVERLGAAIIKGNALKISYLSGGKDESSERVVLPLEIYQASNQTYLNAWCQTSRGDRTFRIDRILSCEATDGEAVNFSAPIEEAKTHSSNIELLVSRGARYFIEENRSIIESSVDGEVCKVKLHSVDVEWLIRTILGFGAQIEVTSPLDLSIEIKNRARAIRALY
ncbi:MAG: WYL domain-containing protein [Actinomycetes bacterium]